MRVFAGWIAQPERRALAALGAAALALACSAGEESRQAAAQPAPETIAVRVGGDAFAVEVAADPATRFRGLSGRTQIPRNGGMLFVLPQPRPFSMVMRDCPVPIDVAFLDSTGRVVAMHAMLPEAPRRREESPFAYEQRLPEYASGTPVQFALETAGGRLAELGLATGDRLHFPAQALIERAR